MGGEIGMNTLYVIGNGFDLHHTLRTEYQDFKEWLYKVDDELANIYKRVCQPTDEKWNDFEESLGYFNKDVFDDIVRNYGNDDVPEMVGEAQFEMNILGQKMKKICHRMKEYILQLNYPETINGFLKIDKESLFLNFNYTNTLERYYNIKRENICYIHNKADDVGDVILGHGEDRFESFSKVEIKPDKLSDKEEEYWRDEMSAQESFYSDLAEEEVKNIHNYLKKETAIHIERNKYFFEKLSEITKIYVFGHSLNEIDLPYFKHIAKMNQNKAMWFVSYHKKDEKNFRTRLGEIGIKNIETCKLTDFI